MKFPCLGNLIFRHDTSEGYWDGINVLEWNKEDPSARLFSRLGDLGRFRNPVDGRFHFKLFYPGTPYLFGTNVIHVRRINASFQGSIRKIMAAAASSARTTTPWKQHTPFRQRVSPRLRDLAARMQGYCSVLIRILLCWTARLTTPGGLSAK